MPGQFLRRTFAVALTGAVVLSSNQSAAGSNPRATRAPRVRLSIDLPATPGPWKMVVANHDVVPVRIAADARGLALLVRGPSDGDYVECKLPKSMRGSPQKRMLVLRPGHRYVEPFDPRLYCWGKTADRLGEGASVTALLGWERNRRRDQRNKPQQAPFVAAPVLAPAAFESQKRLASLTFWLPKRDVVQANIEGSEPPPKFVGAPDLRLSTPRWVDASGHRTARLTATVTNKGDRSALVHLRPDELEVTVRKPNGSVVECSPGSEHRAAVRDFFRKIRPGKKSAVQFLLAEMCPREALERPGLYELSTKLRLRNSGSQFRLDAVTRELVGRRPTLMRLQKARKPFHEQPPRARRARDHSANHSANK